MVMKKIKINNEEVTPPKALVKPPRLISEGRIQKPLREGRGFSIGELREVGLTVQEARRLGLYVDVRRKTIHEWNVKALKEYIEKLVSKGIKVHLVKFKQS